MIRFLYVKEKTILYLLSNFYSVMIHLFLLFCILFDLTHGQVDGTYTYNIENLVHKVCMLARGAEGEHQKSCLRASGLQCLSAMVLCSLIACY